MLSAAAQTITANRGDTFLWELSPLGVVDCDMATLSDNKMTMKPTSPEKARSVGSVTNRASSYGTRNGSVYSSGQRTEIADEWHRILTGRQAPEPVSAKLKTIYGRILNERLPTDMLDLLSQLDGRKQDI